MDTERKGRRREEGKGKNLLPSVARHRRSPRSGERRGNPAGKKKKVSVVVTSKFAKACVFCLRNWLYSSCVFLRLLIFFASGAGDMTGDRMLGNPVSALKKEKGERIPELSRIGPFCVFLSLPPKDRRAPVSILVGSNMERCLLSL